MKIQVVVFTLLVWLCTSSQSVLSQPTWEWGVHTGVAAYLGDLTPDDHWPQWQLARPSLGISVAKNLGYVWQARVNLLWAGLHGDDNLSDDPGFRQRGYRFDTRVSELSLQAVYEPFARRRFPAEGGYRRIWSPYVFAGIGWSRYAATTNFPALSGADNTKMETDLANGPVHQQWSAPFGAGLRWDATTRASLGLELGWRNPFSDYIDGISQAANPTRGDWYVLGALTYSRRFHRPDYDRDGVPDNDDACPRLAGRASCQGCPDADGDGLQDMLDMCPYQAGDPQLNGCPDRDGDGLADLIDDCPDDWGDLTAQGCLDQDCDGIADTTDRCPLIPGIPELGGCPDADGDGIADMIDQCPTEAGLPEFGGCPFADADQDGIKDEEDACPDLAGAATHQGCPDTDADGITDPHDVCPDLAGVVDFGGCPAPTADILETLRMATLNVQFETGSATLTTASLEEMERVRLILLNYPYYHLRMEGHTDSQGKDTANQTLSERRAQACYTYLVDYGIAATRLTHLGLGESKPIATNKTAAGRRLNRRVVFGLYVP